MPECSNAGVGVSEHELPAVRVRRDGGSDELRLAASCGRNEVHVRRSCEVFGRGHSP